MRISSTGAARAAGAACLTWGYSILPPQRRASNFSLTASFAALYDFRLSAVRFCLAHDCCVLGLDFVKHADFTGLRVGIFIYSQIFFRQLVDAFVGAIFGDLDDATANLDITVGIFRIDDGHRNAGIAADVAILLASLGGVEDYALAVKVAPHRRDLRAEGARPAEGEE